MGLFLYQEKTLGEWLPSVVKRVVEQFDPLKVVLFGSLAHREEELRRAFLTSRFMRTLDFLGYARFRHWRLLHGEEALSGREAAP